MYIIISLRYNITSGLFREVACAMPINYGKQEKMISNKTKRPTRTHHTEFLN